MAFELGPPSVQELVLPTVTPSDSASGQKLDSDSEQGLASPMGQGLELHLVQGSELEYHTYCQTSSYHSHNHHHPHKPDQQHTEGSSDHHNQHPSLDPLQRHYRRTSETGPPSERKLGTDLEVVLVRQLGRVLVTWSVQTRDLEWAKQ